MEAFGIVRIELLLDVLEQKFLQLGGV
jgi:hypothetical protein